MEWKKDNSVPEFIIKQYKENGAMSRIEILQAIYFARINKRPRKNQDPYSESHVN